MRATRTLAAAALSAALAGPVAAQEDPLGRVCRLEPDHTEAQCACAAEAMAQARPEADLALYAAVLARYIQALEAGQARAAAWDAAVELEAAARGVTPIDILPGLNRTGRVHREAIRDCG